MLTTRRLAWRMLRRDLTRDLGAGVSLLLVLTLGAALLATGALALERLTARGDQLAAQTRPPHLLQMHSGDYDRQALEDFAHRHPEIQAWTIEDLAGVDGAALSCRSADGSTGTPADSVTDNLFVTRNTAFDLLVDPDGTAVAPAPGTVHVPVAVQQRYDLHPGDVLRIDTGSSTVELTVAGTVRDGQMTSSLSSSTRFLVHPRDWQELAGWTSIAHEIIVEHRLHDEADVPALQAAYAADPALPREGRAVTISLIRLITVIGDGLVAIALMGVSVALVLIALLSLRFVIRADLEHRVRELGTLRAIGLTPRTITRLLLTRYRALSLAACVLGGLLAIGGAALLTGGPGSSTVPLTGWTVLAPLLAPALVHLVVVLSCRGVLRAVRRVPIVGALVHGSLRGDGATARRARRRARAARATDLATAPGGTVSRRLALLGLRRDARSWMLLPLVFALVTIVATVPLAVHATFSSPRLVTSMGAPDRDLRSDVRVTADAPAVTDRLLSAMATTAGVTDVSVTGSVLVRIDTAEGTRTQAVDVGEHSGEGIRYVAGTAPGRDELALSVLAADAYGVAPGDTLAIAVDGRPSVHVVRGIYQDITDGGMTAALRGDLPADASAYTLYADVADGVSAPEVAAALSAQVPEATTIPMDRFVGQTFSSVTEALRGAAILAIGLCVGVAVLITALVLRLRRTRERPRAGVLRALGFPARAVAGQLRLQALLVIVPGVVLGALAAALVGPPVVGAVLSAAGLALPRFAFLAPVAPTWILLPGAVALAGYLAAVLVSAPSRTADLSPVLRG